jgi:hypothetical protein
MSSSIGKGSAKRLSEQQRLEIIVKLRKPNPPSKRSVAREYNVNEKAVRRIWDNRSDIEQRSSLMPSEKRATTFRASVGHFSEVEDKLYTWIEAMQRAHVTVSPSLAMVKAKQIAAELSISEESFKASWGWLKGFRARRGLQETFHVEGGEVDKNNAILLPPLEDLCNVNSDDKSESAQMEEEKVAFLGFENLYNKVLALEDQLQCKEFENEAGEQYNKIISSFAFFQDKVRALTTDIKRRQVA